MSAEHSAPQALCSSGYTHTRSGEEGLFSRSEEVQVLNVRANVKVSACAGLFHNACEGHISENILMIKSLQKQLVLVKK